MDRPPLLIEAHHNLPENDKVDEQGGRGPQPCCPDMEPISDDEEEDEEQQKHGFLRSRLRPSSPSIKKRPTQKAIDDNLLLSKRKSLLGERRNIRSGLPKRTHSCPSLLSSGTSRYSTDTTMRTPSKREEQIEKMNRRLSELSKLSNLAKGQCPNQSSSCIYYDLDGVGLSQKKITDSRIKNRENKIRDMNERLKGLKLKLGSI
jgi:hypothetical protein